MGQEGEQMGRRGSTQRWGQVQRRRVGCFVMKTGSPGLGHEERNLAA